jgi:hypothetical protein
MVLFVLMVPSLSLAARIEAMETLEPRAHFAKQGVSLDAIAAAVVAATDRDNWRTQAVGPGSMLAELSTKGGKHRVTVALTFDRSTFVIRYHSSHNLNYRENYCRQRTYGNPHQRQRSRCVGAGIHPYYNLWIGQLQSSILDEISMLVPGGPKPPAHSQSAVPASASMPSDGPIPVLVADEMRKLKQLYDEGTLSDEEYDQQKQKLLAQ